MALEMIGDWTIEDRGETIRLGDNRASERSRKERMRIIEYGQVGIANT
jgi:hypothetical protein